jgi:hypothetical protein
MLEIQLAVGLANRKVFQGYKQEFIMVSVGETQTLVKAYYDSWLQSDRQSARACLDDNLVFHSPQDNFNKADTFLEKCWIFAEGFDEMHYLHELYAADGAYVVYRSGEFCCGELLKLRDGRICEIYVSFNPTS